MLHGSLYRSGYELLYTPLPLVQKRATKAIVDVGFDKVGVGAGRPADGRAARDPAAAARRWASLAGAIAVSVACLAILPRLHRGYVGSLEESLRSGSVRLEQDDVLDGTTRYTLARTGLALDRGRAPARDRGDARPHAPGGPTRRSSARSPPCAAGTSRPPGRRSRRA